MLIVPIGRLYKIRTIEATGSAWQRAKCSSRGAVCEFVGLVAFGFGWRVRAAGFVVWVWP
jgi:hypothetical protein